MSGGDKDVPLEVQPPLPAAGPQSIETHLLLELLRRLGGVEKGLARTEAQNVHLIEGAKQADASRARMYERLNKFQDDLSTTGADAKAARSRLDVLEPIVNALKGSDLERTVVRAAVMRVLKNGWTAAGAAASGVAVIWHQWDTIRDFLLKSLNR